MKKPIGLIAASMIVVIALVGCGTNSTPVQPNSDTPTQNQSTIGNSQSQTSTNNRTDTSSNPTPTAPTAQSTDVTTTLLLNMVQLAQQGKIINSDFPAKTSRIEDIEKVLGKPDQTDTVANTGTYATFANNYVAFGFNKAGQIFEVRSLASHQFVGITLAKAKEVLGTPAYDTKYNGQEIIGYQAGGSEFKLEMVFPLPTTNNPNPPMDHYNVLYPQGTTNIMGVERQW